MYVYGKNFIFVFNHLNIESVQPTNFYCFITGMGALFKFIFRVQRKKSENRGTLYPDL